jgi:hypothetical protein
MKRLMATMFVAFSLMASPAFASEASHWAIRDGANWTANDNVQVSYSFTEGGVQVGAAQLFIGPLLPGDNDRPVDTTQFVGSGRMICLNANAFRQVEPTVLVAATPNCYRFPFSPIDPAIIVPTP